MQQMAEVQLQKKDYDQALSFAIRSYDIGAQGLVKSVLGTGAPSAWPANISKTRMALVRRNNAPANA